jgi:hypothetical protein
MQPDDDDNEADEADDEADDDGNTGLKQFFGDFLNMYIDYIST